MLGPYQVGNLDIKPKIAIVDDDASIRDTLQMLLFENGFSPIPMASIQDFLELGENPDVNLVLIDLKLRGESGLTLANHVNTKHNIPIIMLTGTGDEIDKILGLESGADDYVMKPFNPRELIARIKAVLRRSTGTQLVSRAYEPQSDDVITFGRHQLNMKTSQLTNDDGEEIALTNGEYKILQYLLRNPDRIIPRIELLEELGGDLTRFMDRTIDVMILRIRRKIEQVPSKPIHLQTRRGQGYIFVGIRPSQN